MTATADLRARRYLLGEASDEECAALEQEYLEHETALDRVAAAEDDLIEDFLSGHLSPSDRDRFEKTYLSSPHHRLRVATVRRLMAQAGGLQPARPQGRKSVLSWTRVNRGPLLALAASLLVIASVALWRSSLLRRPEGEIAGTPAPQAVPASPDRPASPPAKAPRLFALTLSPVTVRGGDETPSIAIPSGTDTLVIRFESEMDGRKLVARRASVRTVSGDELWQGPVTPDAGPPPGTVARIDVPAATLPADDYLVTLYGTDPSGVEREWARYFLRLRTQGR